MRATRFLLSEEDVTNQQAGKLQKTLLWGYESQTSVLTAIYLYIKNVGLGPLKRRTCRYVSVMSKIAL